MGGKSPGQPGAYDDPNPSPFVDSLRQGLPKIMAGLGPGFWGPQGAPTQQSLAAASAPGGDTAAPAAAPANIQLGATEAAAPAAAQQQGSGQTTQEQQKQAPQGAGDAMAQAVAAPPVQWQDEMKKAMQPGGSMTVTGQV